MKKEILVGLIALLLIPSLGVPLPTEAHMLLKTQGTTPGDIIGFFCSEPHPTMGEPVTLFITIAGKAGERFNETLTITDEFQGLTIKEGRMMEISGNVTISQFVLTIGKLPVYTKKIPWYPSIVGNHTIHIVAGAFPEENCQLSVSFDVDGIITPSLGCPSIINKNKTSDLSVTISEKRKLSEETAQITQVTLKEIDSTTSYNIDNLTTVWTTRIAAGTTSVQDVVVACYDLESIPDGFYNISVTTTKKNYSWPHAVKIISIEPTEYRVVQLSDIHIGKYSNFANKKKELTRLIAYMEDVIHPDFVILSGDSVDWYNKKSARNVYLDLQEVLLTCTIPVFTVPGNHERYGNSLLFLYSPCTNLTPYHLFLCPLDDYSFTYGGMNFIFLDSGYEVSRVEISRQIWNTTPEGSGLTSLQIALLENLWGQPSMNQIISMHHPAVNDINDTSFGAVPNTLPSGNDECIVQNRGGFISYCEGNNVSLVLTGHTHDNHVFTSLGKETTNYTAWPLFIQTDSATLNGKQNGGRVIHIKNSAIVSYDYVPFS